MAKKASLADALASKAPAAPPPAPEPAPVAAAPKAADAKLATTLRIEPEKLERLKVIAVRQRKRVNDLVLEGVDHVLALYAGKQ